MASKITRLVEAQDDKSKQLRTRDLVVEVEKMQGGLKNLSMQEKKALTPKVIREKAFHLNPLKDPQQCEVTMLREDKNKNGKRNLVLKSQERRQRSLARRKQS
jgi:hypothetical protein